MREMCWTDGFNRKGLGGPARSRIAGLLVAILVAHRPVDAALDGMQRVATGLSSPMFVTHAPGDPTRLFIAERGSPGNSSSASARIRILDLQTGSLLTTPFLTIGGLNNMGEGGLLGLAFHPDYATNGKFYVNVTANDSITGTPFSTYIREYTVSSDPNVASSTFNTVLTFGQPQSNHNGGWIGFSPNDGYLYVATGDGGNGNDQGGGHTEPGGNSQDLTSNLLGKMLRVDVNGDDFPTDVNRNYRVPSTNPFVGVAGDDEIWSYGLRNPFRSSFDRVTGDLWIGDVGQDRREEIDFQPASSDGGENYGWRLREGLEQTQTGSPVVGGAKPAGNVDPVYDYFHSGLGGNVNLQGNAVVGGHVYRGPDPSLQGMYFFGDTVSGRLWMFDPANPFGTVQQINAQLAPDAGSVVSPVAFGEDATGNLYLVALSSNSVFRIKTDELFEGDFDGDGIVDGADLSIWVDNFGAESGATLEVGDADADGDVDGGDFLIWQQNLGQSPFGLGAVSSAARVPEPAGLVIAAMTAAATIVLRRRRDDR